MMQSFMEVQRFDRITLFGRRWFFRIVDTENNEKLVQSEAYNSAQARNKTANRFKAVLGCEIKDVA